MTPVLGYINMISIGDKVSGPANGSVVRYLGIHLKEMLILIKA